MFGDSGCCATARSSVIGTVRTSRCWCGWSAGASSRKALPTTPNSSLPPHLGTQGLVAYRFPHRRLHSPKVQVPLAGPQKGQTGRPQMVQARVQTAQRGSGPPPKDRLEDRLRATLRNKPQQEQSLPHRQAVQRTLELLPKSRHPEGTMDAAGGPPTSRIRDLAGRFQEVVLDRQVHGGQDRKRTQKQVQPTHRQAAQEFWPPH